MYTLSEILIYPIKSLGGIALSESNVEMRGLEHDRRWMIVNENGRFMSQREIVEMALLRTALDGPDLLVFHKDKPADVLRIPLAADEEALERAHVAVWDDNCIGAVVSPMANAWFSDVLGQHLRLVVMPEATHRQTDARYAPDGQYVSFADGFPFLLIGQASLDDLNNRLESPIPMNRFRPNLVFTGGQPFEEDSWSDFSIGDVAFRGVKPCGRCIMPTINQENGNRAAEPLKTLAGYRSFGNKICFGQNCIWMGEGKALVRVGDKLRLSEK